MGCYVAIGKTCTRDAFTTLDAVLDKYQCDYCPASSDFGSEWLCAAQAETMELHPGFLDFGTSFDMLITHSHHVTANMLYVASHTLKNGVTMKNFIVTDNGFLADTDLQKPGTKLFFVTGYAKHSKLYMRLNPGAWPDYSWHYPNPNYAGVRGMVYTFTLILNPAQERDILRGKMSLDLDPSCLSDWCVVFLDCWNLFIELNPGTKVTDIYRTSTGLYYGSPTDHSQAHPLLLYRGLPLLLSYYQDRISAHVRQIIILSKMRLTDIDADVPAGKYYCLCHFCYIYLVLDCPDVQKYVDGRFGKTGRLVPLGDDPLSSFNLLLGKIVLCLWEMVDTFNLLGLPRDSKSPLSQKWRLTDFVPKKVRSLKIAPTRLRAVQD